MTQARSAVGNQILIASILRDGCE